MASRRARSVALGFSAHTGWAAVVGISGPPDAPAIVAKSRVELATTFETGAVFHAAQKLRLDEAEVLVRAIGAIAADLRGRELEARAAGLTETRVASILADVGKASGKPWTKDEKEAALAAWLALAGGLPRAASSRADCAPG